MLPSQGLIQRPRQGSLKTNNSGKFSDRLIAVYTYVSHTSRIRFMIRLIFIVLTSLMLGTVSVPSAAQAQFVMPSAQFYPSEAIAPASSRHHTPIPIAQLALNSPMFSFSGTRPSNLGVTDGKLAACPGTPNCVSSQAPESDKEHFIAPLPYQKSPADAMAALKSVIEGMERTKIVSESDNYLYAEFTSALMGFVDDVEFYLDEDTGVIHVRSASRLGQSDLGVNRKRVEDIRAKFVTIS